MLAKNIMSISAVNIFKAIVQLLLNMVVIRFVSPSDFGVVAFALPFIAFIALLTDLGISSAIVRQKDLAPRDAGAAMSLILFIAVVFALGLSGSSGYIQQWTGMADLRAVISGLAVSLTLSIAAVVPRALLERELAFPKIALVELISTLIAATASIAALTVGLGVFSIIVYYIVVQLLRSSIFLFLVRRRLDLNFRWRPIRPMIAFGGWVLASNVLSFMARNGDNILIGGYLGAHAVGLYGFAYQIMTMPLVVIAWPASGILMATLSREIAANADRDRKTQIISAVMSGTALLTIPGMSYLVFAAPFLIDVVFGSRWNEASSLIVVLAPVGALQALSVYVGSVLLASGRARQQFWWSLLNNLIFLAMFLIALPYGIVVFSQAYAVTGTILALAGVGLIAVVAQISIGQIARTVGPPVAASALGLAIAYATATAFTPPYLAWLSGTVAYVLILAASFAFLRKSIREQVLPLFSMATKAR